MRYTLIICLFLSACGDPVKKVLRDPAKTATVAWQYLKRQAVMPSDTIYKYAAGDSVIKVVTQSDTTYIFDSLYLPVERVVTKWQTRYVTRTDTVTRTVADRTLLADYQKQNIAQQVAIDQLSKDMKEEKNKSNSWMWRFFITIGIIVILGGLFIYSKTKA